MSSEVSIRDLRNHGGEVVERVAHGERVVITRAGKPVAQLTALTEPINPLTKEQVLEKFRHLPRMDAAALRRDIDEATDQSL